VAACPGYAPWQACLNFRIFNFRKLKLPGRLHTGSQLGVRSIAQTLWVSSLIMIMIVVRRDQPSRPPFRSEKCGSWHTNVADAFYINVKIHVNFLYSFDQHVMNIEEETASLDTLLQTQTHCSRQNPKPKASSLRQPHPLNHTCMIVLSWPGFVGVYRRVSCFLETRRATEKSVRMFFRHAKGLRERRRKQTKGRGRGGQTKRERERGRA